MLHRLSQIINVGVSKKEPQDPNNVYAIELAEYISELETSSLVERPLLNGDKLILKRNIDGCFDISYMVRIADSDKEEYEEEMFSKQSLQPESGSRAIYIFMRRLYSTTPKIAIPNFN